MSQGHNFLYSVIKANNRTYLSKVKREFLADKTNSGEPTSERELYDFVTNHVLQFRSLPSIAVLKAAGINYVDTDQPPEYYLQEIKKRTVYNTYKNFQKNVQPLLTSEFNIDEVTSLISEFSESVAHINASDRYKTLSELGREIEVQIESRKNGNPEVFVPFGWPTLDSLTGGLSGGDLAYFIARPGVGKTNILTYASHYAWTQGFSPMLLTMEMTDIQISRRLYGLQGAFNPDAIRRGIPDSEVERKLGSAIESFEGGIPFHIICGQTKQTVESITALVDELQPDVLYIDAAYLVSMNGPTKATWEKLAAVSERLKQVAITRNIPIIMTVQFNREASKGKRFELDTIAGSDAIGQLASLVVAIKEGEDQYEEIRRILSVLKNREGGVAEFQINNRFSPPDFTEVVSGELDEDEEDQVIL